MRVFITGEKGFIGTNLIERAKQFKDIEIVTRDNGNYDHYFIHFKKQDSEPCVHKNKQPSWESFFRNEKIDVVIHNAAVVGTDVVALNSTESTLTNVEGTYRICRAAKATGVNVCYMGTTVIYDTQKYQEVEIQEDSDRGPHTLYGCQKLCAEDIVKTQSDKWMIIRPLFAYGGIGDMNSLIAKTIYAALNNKKQIDMFLDPHKIKDYMHVNDYCDAVITAIKQGLWFDDYNVAAETPLTTWDIITKVCAFTGLKLDDVVKWHPETDYLGNHRLSCNKFSYASDWRPKISLELGIHMSYTSILESKGYNPLTYLEEAKEKKIDLTQFY